MGYCLNNVELNQPHHNMLSARLRELQTRKNNEHKKMQEVTRQIERRKPHKCQLCHRQACHGGNLCPTCCQQQRSLQSECLVNQGCPYFLRKTRGMFQWHLEFPELAQWTLTALNLTVEPPLKHSRSKRIIIMGWKESTDIHEARSIESMSPILDRVDSVNECPQLKELNLPSQLITPNEVIKLINSFILRHQIMAWNQVAGRRLESPEIQPDLCQSPRCPNSAIVFPYCADCCRKYYRVEVRPSTIHASGLGLFATGTFKSGEYVCDYCYDMVPKRKGCHSKQRADM